MTVTLAHPFADPRDLILAAVPTTIPAAPTVATADPSTTTVNLFFTDPAPTAQQVAALQALALTDPQPANAPWRIGAALATNAQTALANNVTYLGLATPTTGQAVAQVAALTRQIDALARIVLGLLDTTQGT